MNPATEPTSDLPLFPTSPKLQWLVLQWLNRSKTNCCMVTNVMMVRPLTFFSSKLFSQSLSMETTCPKFKVDPMFMEQLSIPWRRSLVIKVLGKSVGYKALCSRVEQLWRLRGEITLLDLGKDYFLVKFDLQEDLDIVISGGPL